jgi:hypothetical protein
MSKPIDLVQGTLDLLILKVIAPEPLHGWAIAQRIRQMSGDVLQVGQSALYPALHKLERNGWLKAEWKTFRDESSGKVLRPHAQRTEGRGGRSRELGAVCPRRFPPSCALSNPRYPTWLLGMLRQPHLRRLHRPPADACGAGTAGRTPISSGMRKRRTESGWG